MNNIFYEFLEKNKLNGLEDVLEELPIFEESTMKFPGLPRNVPQPSSIDLIGVEFKLNNIMYNFYVSNVGTKTYCFITDAMMNVLGINEQKNILATIITAGIEHTGKTLPKQTSDKIFKAGLFAKHNLTNPKNGQDAQIDSLNITANKKTVFTYTSIYFNQLKQQKVEMVDIAKTGTNSTQGDMQGGMQDNMQGTGKGSVENTIQNKTGVEEKGMKTGSSFKSQVEQERKKIKKEKSAREVAVALMGREELIEKAKAENDPVKRLQIILPSPHFEVVKDSLSYIIDAIKKLNNQNVFKKDYDAKLKEGKVSYYKDIEKGPRNTKYNTELGIIHINLLKILPLVKKHKLFANVNEILNAYSNKDDEKKAISWFYENHVNNHFTMKRIFNS